MLVRGSGVEARNARVQGASACLSSVLLESHWSTVTWPAPWIPPAAASAVWRNGELCSLILLGPVQMFGKKISGQKTQKLFMTPAVSSAVAPSARNFQSIQQVLRERDRDTAKRRTRSSVCACADVRVLLC